MMRRDERRQTPRPAT